MKLPLSVEVGVAAIGIRAGSSPRYSRRRTPAPRTRRGRTRRRRRRSALRGASGGLPPANPGVEVGQQVQGSGDEDGAVSAGEPPRALQRLDGILDRPDVGEAGAVDVEVARGA